jgi:predicted GNAT superfamily acetyltransferase
LERVEVKRSQLKYTIRPCQKLEELAAIVKVQREIWGYAEHELYPLRLFVTLKRIGGEVLGAFTPQGSLVGFVASLPAWHGVHRYYHSLSLGVLRAYENRGLGRALKMAQRRAALRAGIDLIEWSFDPLRAKNAYLNIVRLGAIARRYQPDYYGQVESRLQRGLPSDRLIVEWRLRSARVKRAMAGKPPRRSQEKPAAVVEIPANIDQVMRSNPQQARQRQLAVRQQLQEFFAHKLAITGFEYDGKSARYLLDPYED